MSGYKSPVFPEVTYVAKAQNFKGDDIAHLYLGDTWIGVLYPTNKYETDSVYVVLFTQQPDLANGLSSEVAGIDIGISRLDKTLRSLALLYPPF